MRDKYCAGCSTNILNAQSGFSLIGALTAAGLVSVIALGLASVVSDGWTQLGRQSAKFEQISLANELRTELSMSTLCAEGLTSTTQPYKIDAKGGLNFKFRTKSGFTVEAGATRPGSNVVIDSLRFVPI